MYPLLFAAMRLCRLKVKGKRLKVRTVNFVALSFFSMPPFILLPFTFILYALSSNQPLSGSDQ